MPRYFFDVHDGRTIIDEDGTLLADDEEARNVAVVHAGETLRELGPEFWRSAQWHIEVREESGRIVCRLRFVAEPQSIV